MTPTVGRIVLYRSRSGVDYAAIITALGGADGFVHLHQFPPPGHAEELPVDREWGTPEHDGDEPLHGTWRWPTRQPDPAAAINAALSDPNVPMTHQLAGAKRTVR